MKTREKSTMTIEEWKEKGAKLFGEDFFNWRVVCPSCGNIQTPEDFRQFKEKGANPNSAFCECIGRYTGTKNEMGSKKKPCNYAGYGLFRLSPVLIIHEDGSESECFAFDESESDGQDV